MGNSPGPTGSGNSSEAPTLIGEGDFPSELSDEQIWLHMMNNEVIKEATLDLGRAMDGDGSYSSNVAEYRGLLEDFYGNPDLTEADIPALGLPVAAVGGASETHARRLIEQRDFHAQRFEQQSSGAQDRWERAVEAELEVVREKFAGLAQLLGGPSEDAVENRAQINEINAAVAALTGQYEAINAELQALQPLAATLPREEFANLLRDGAVAFDDWTIIHDNPYVAGFGADMSGVLYDLRYRPGMTNAALLDQYQRRLEQAVLSHAEGLVSDYPSEYKEYNTLLAGGHIVTWSERWWTFARAAAWIIGAEIAGRIVAGILAPVTLGASVAVVNLATQIGRTRVLGGVIRGIGQSRSASAVIRAGGQGIAYAQWILSLPDIVMDWAFARFSQVAARVFARPRIARPDPADASTIPGTPGAAAAANCCVRNRG